MTRPNTFPQKTLLAVAVASALAGLAPAVVLADTVITSSNSPTTTQTWATGNYMVNSDGSVNVSSSSTVVAIQATPSGGDLGNNGTISASAAAGQGTGVSNSGTIGTLTNSGAISGSGISNGYGIANSSTINTLTNTGTISGIATNGTGAGIFNENAGTIGTLTNNGTITGTGAGISNGSFNTTGTIDTLVNNGRISGGVSSGVGNFSGSHIGTLTNNGTITGGTATVWNDGTIGTITNTGYIQGGIDGIDNNGGATIGTIINTGYIQGSPTGIDNSGTIGSLTNSGVITGSTYAIANQQGASLGPITNSGTIAGNIENLSSTALTINGGTGTLFGTLTGASNGTTLGTITSDAGVIFSTGNLVLNDNIVASTGGVTNSGAVLQVNRPVTISGNYTQDQAATLQIGVASGATTTGSITADAGYGQLLVTGQTSIAAQSHITLQSLGYAFAAGQRYVVIATAGAATYNADTLNYSMNGYTGSVTGTAVADSTSNTEDLVLTVNSATLGSTSSTTGTSSSPTLGGATNPNAIHALQGLLNYTGVSNAQFLNLYDAVLGEIDSGSSATANRVGKQLAPTLNGSASIAPTIDTLNVIGDRVDAIRTAQASGGTGVATGEDPLQWNAWGKAFGGHASQDERDGVDGYSANYGGLLVGVDRAINDHWRVGGVFSYSNTSINNTGDTAGDTTTINNYGLLGYASFTGINSWYLNLQAGIVQGHYDESRVLDSVTGIDGKSNGDYNGQQYVARAKAGYPLALGNMTLTPLASLTYSYLHQGAYTESGGAGDALSVDASHSTSFKSSLGAKLEQGFSTKYGEIVPDVQAQWVHEYVHTRQVTGAQFAADPSETGFTTVGASPVSDLADLSVGVMVLRENTLSVSVRYELQAGSGYVSQTGIVRLTKSF